jgi:mevalonate kinase
MSSSSYSSFILHPSSFASAPGKVILFGEHAVVYGRPAIAAPVTQVRATALVENSSERGIRIIAPDLEADFRLEEAAEDDPLALAARLVLAAAPVSVWPNLTITVQSQIPIASGLGSGAATAAATIRALAQHLGLAEWATDERVSALTYQVEQIHHGTPSGIDNTVVAYERPVYFVRRQPQNLVEPFQVAAPLRLLVADTGVRSSTKIVVGDVRRQWQEDSARFEAIFDGCGRIAQAARAAIEQGRIEQLGRLMNENQVLLEEMTVSSPELERLVRAANTAGALGAKLSGAGRGGNMIALVEEGTEEVVREVLLAAEARTVLTSVIQ